MTRDAIADNFRVVAQNGGRQGEQQLLDKMNYGLKSDGSQYRLRFGQNIIKTPGGRHLEIIDGSGRVTDSMDFVVPSFTRHKDGSAGVFKNQESDTDDITKQIAPNKQQHSNYNVTQGIG